MPRKIDPAKIKVGHGLAASDSVEVNAMIPSGAGSAPAGLTTHVQDEHNAHPAHAVSIDNVPDTYDAHHVEGALDELSALVPPRPSTIGMEREYLAISTIPDWGILKLDDGTISKRHSDTLGLDWDNDLHVNGEEVYPYFWTPFQCLEGSFRKVNDHQNNAKSDRIFNVYDPSYKGGGPGNAHAGCFARVEDDGSRTFQSTATIIPSSGPKGGQPVVVSGTVYPADRGTLAILRFCPGGGFEEMCHDEDLLKRVICAINLGQGILDKCDGDPGGIFYLGDPGGDDAPHSFDPYSFPGRATGQYNLDEIHRGRLATGPGFLLPAPFDDFDGDGTEGWNYGGQVRLGTDPNAGMPVLPNGVPILGGSTFARGGGHDSNFFGYRLPYMADYDLDTGLRYTPSSAKWRYYERPAVSLDAHLDLPTFGAYDAFPKEYWTWQIGRFRHQFQLDQEILLDGQLRESGSYVLIHFKKEEYFEAAVRDGVWNSEHVYSAYFNDDTNVEDLANKVYRGDDGIYHTLQSLVVEDPGGAEKPHEDLYEVGTQLVNPVSFGMYSGVSYAIPGNPSKLDYQTQLMVRLNFNLLPNPADPTTTGFWDGTWRNTEKVQEQESFANEQPVFFTFGQLVNNAKIHSQAGLLADNASKVWKFKRERLEISAIDLESGAGLVDTPGVGDLAKVEGVVTFRGDKEKCKFSQDAKIRAFVRRPLNHLSDIEGAGVDPAEVIEQINWTYLPIENPGMLLFHGSRCESWGDSSDFGNWMQGGGKIADSVLNREDKLYSERFLDESFRWRSDFRNGAGADIFGPTDQAQLVGPGLPHGATPIKIPVRFDIGLPAPMGGLSFKEWHYLASSSHWQSLAHTQELQVAGLPDRSPRVTEGRVTPIPCNGILMYPQKNYDAGYVPSTADTIGVGLPTQPDYTGVSGTRHYLRTFSLEGGSGSSLVKFTFKGIQLEHFMRSPGAIGNPDYLAIEVKVPGLTTWMDLGRKDGSGPSKQDPFKDGAGCLVVGADTKNHGPDDKHGIVSCSAKAHLGPSANLFEAFNGEVPLLVRVTMYDTPSVKTLNWEQGGAHGPCEDLRGLIQMDVELID